MNETIFNNGKIQKKTDAFLWIDINSGRTSAADHIKRLYDKDKFDLYTDFENVKKWFLENGSYFFYAAWGYGFRDEKFFNSKKFKSKRI